MRMDGRWGYHGVCERQIFLCASSLVFFFLLSMLSPSPSLLSSSFLFPLRVGFSPLLFSQVILNRNCFLSRGIGWEALASFSF
ncbi:hypothetical protein BS50DRAFT_174717 [Corynespora cassiicola Philippines]|uniref:Uncharacterized protein n=1 Tax=Corynespora cassiicola Philippines TaxID=1448308 RepID=A0A2T2P655_CORCC|nr:hypothetical protein BS50DRAFT_174717 [Corynespora cassiicola Philippines]